MFDEEESAGSPINPDGNPEDKKDGVTPLLTAAKEGHAEIVRYLVEEKGADPRLPSLSGATPLFSAAKRGHMEVVRLLVDELGVDPGERNVIDGGTALWAAARVGNLEMLEFLLERGASADGANVDGLTPMMAAALSGKSECVRLLIDQGGADPNAREKKGDTAMIMACAMGGTEIVEFLARECDADPNIAGRFGDTALIVACKKGHLDIVKFLVEESKVDPDAKNEETGGCPFFHACEYGQLAVVRYLANEAKAKTSVRCSGLGPIHAATARGHLEVVEFLITDVGVDANEPDDKGFTPFDIAEKLKLEPLMQYLILRVTPERRKRFKRENPAAPVLIKNSYEVDAGEKWCFCFRLNKGPQQHGQKRNQRKGSSDVKTSPPKMHKSDPNKPTLKPRSSKENDKPEKSAFV
jgi:ankyrin repeat protein